MGHKLTSWNNQVLFNADKVVLIKSNLTGVPHFFMNCFKIPNYMYKDMTKLIRTSFGIKNKEIDT